MSIVMYSPDYHKYLYSDDKGMFDKVVELANRLIKLLDSSYSCTIEPKRRPTPGNAIGLCYQGNRIAILIRYKDSVRNGSTWHSERLSDKTIFETVAHEIAHLKHFNHGSEFKKLEQELISKI